MGDQVVSQAYRVVVGLDGSPASVAALRWAARLPSSDGTELVVVSALDAPAATRPDDATEQQLHSRLARVDEWIVASVRSDVRITSRVDARDPRSAIRDAVSEVDADMVVVGRSAATGRQELGKTVEYLVQRLTCALAVIPLVARPIERIVLGVDGSTASLAGVEWCARHIDGTDALVFAVEAREPDSVMWDDSADRRIEVESEIDAWTEPLRFEGVRVEHVALLHQHPARALRHVASARHADLIVIGSRGAGGVPDLRVGGVAMKLLHDTTMPLVIVPPPDAPASR